MDEVDEVASMLRQSALAFVSARHDVSRARASADAPGPVDSALWREIGDLGWLGLGLPERLGGSGAGLRVAAELADVFGRTLFPLPYVAACVMPSAILAGCDDTPAVGELAAELAAGKRLITVAWQEQPAELFPGGAATTCVGDRVRGCKQFVPAVERDGVMLVYLESEGVPSIVAVASDAAGVRLDCRASGMGTMSTVRFDDAPALSGVPLLAGERARSALRAALDCARLTLCAMLNGIAGEALAKTLRYVTDRVQFGRPVGSFQVIQHRCVDLHIGVELAGASLRHALRVHAAEPGGARSQQAISAAKARCGDVALQVCRAAVQMHGAMGFAEEGDVGCYLRAAMHGASWLGTAPAHRRRLGHAHFAEYLDG